MEAYLKPSFVEKTLIVNEEGELLDEKVNKHTYIANSKEEFWLMYSSMILVLKQSSDVKIKLFAYLLEKYGNGAEFAMNLSLKKKIAIEVGCKHRSLDLAFTTLIKEYIVVKIDTRLYKINPRHVFQGSTNERLSSLKAVLTICTNC